MLHWLQNSHFQARTATMRQDFAQCSPVNVAARRVPNLDGRAPSSFNRSDLGQRLALSWDVMGFVLVSTVYFTRSQVRTTSSRIESAVRDYVPSFEEHPTSSCTAAWRRLCCRRIHWRLCRSCGLFRTVMQPTFASCDARILRAVLQSNNIRRSYCAMLLQSTH